MKLFIYRYQANSLYTFSEISNYSKDMRDKIKNISPFRAQSQIVPEDEKKRFIKIFDDLELNDKLSSDLIIINKTDKFSFLPINNIKFLKVYSGKVYDIYQVNWLLFYNYE